MYKYGQTLKHGSIVVLDLLITWQKRGLIEVVELVHVTDPNELIFFEIIVCHRGLSMRMGAICVNSDLRIQYSFAAFCFHRDELYYPYIFSNEHRDLIFKTMRFYRRLALPPRPFRLSDMAFIQEKNNANNDDTPCTNTSSS